MVPPDPVGRESKHVVKVAETPEKALKKAEESCNSHERKCRLGRAVFCNYTPSLSSLEVPVPDQKNFPLSQDKSSPSQEEPLSEYYVPIAFSNNAWGYGESDDLKKAQSAALDECEKQRKQYPPSGMDAPRACRVGIKLKNTGPKKCALILETPLDYRWPVKLYAGKSAEVTYNRAKEVYVRPIKWTEGPATLICAENGKVFKKTHDPKDMNEKMWKILYQ